MKLDNIIYDVDSLATAITEQWNAESEAFKAMYPSDTATALINVFAGYGSMLQYMLLGAVANCYTTTAFSTAGIYQLADTLGNNLHGNISSQVTVMMSKKSHTSVETIIPAKTQFSIRGKKFFNPTAIVIPATSSPVEDIVLVQGEVLTTTQTTSGIANEKFYFSSDFKANHNYVKVYVNGEEWDVQTSFLDYDKNYVINASVLNTVILKTEPDGRTCIKVGDNQLGTLPASDSTLLIEYVSNEGSNGNIAEIGIPVDLVTPLLETENGVTSELQLSIKTTSTAFGGADTQSIDILRYTSPYVFASGHRAIRRQDYIAMLLNECGYLAANVWGEYEEAEKVGAYDALMMNMVYYTGIKSFQNYQPFVIGTLGDSYETYDGMINSTNGFWGSFTLTINNLKNTTAFVRVQDSGAHGILFINDNEQDPRDSLLPLWVKSTQDKHYLEYPVPYVSQGEPYTPTGYQVNDELRLLYNGANTQVIVIVDEVENGVPTLIHTAEENPVVDSAVIISDGTHDFTTVNVSAGSQGVNFKVTADITTKKESKIVTSDDEIDEAGYINQNTITCARSDITDENTYFMSMHEPTLNRPVQIFIDFEERTAETWAPGVTYVASRATLVSYEGGLYYCTKTHTSDASFDVQYWKATERETTITGIKFKATNKGAFIGSIAMFGTNDQDAYQTQRSNIRNSNRWDVVIPRTTLKNPLGNDNGNWTDWIATNLFNGETYANEPVFKQKYLYYVIEIYSIDESVIHTSSLLTIESMKVLFAEDSSLLYYDDNGKFTLNFPLANSPGPDGTQATSGTINHTTIGKTLINTDILPAWAYEVTTNGITTQNDYREGNVLAYTYENAITGEKVNFLIEVVNATTGVYNITIEGDSSLTGTNYIMTEGTPQVVPAYEEFLTGTGYVSDGAGYLPNDYIALKTRRDISATDYDIYARVTAVNQEALSNGEIRGVLLMPSKGYEKTYTVNSVFLGEFDTQAIINTGSGATITVNGKVCSGIPAEFTFQNRGTGYMLWDKVVVNARNTSYQGLVCKVGSSGEVLGLRLDVSSTLENKRLSGNTYIDLPNTATGLSVYCASTAGRGGTISITSDSNLSIAAAFTGNRMDTATINLFDQPIIKKYNHFTTYLEFQQPAMRPESITVQVSLNKMTSTTSGIIIQNVKNALYSLFDLKPDSIGKGLKLSKIYTTVMDVKDVEWCKVVTPTGNIETAINELLVPSDIRIINVTEAA